MAGLAVETHDGTKDGVKNREEVINGISGAIALSRHLHITRIYSPLFFSAQMRPNLDVFGTGPYALVIPS
jgi:hypothetical protein